MFIATWAAFHCIVERWAAEREGEEEVLPPSLNFPNDVIGGTPSKGVASAKVTQALNYLSVAKKLICIVA